MMHGQKNIKLWCTAVCTALFFRLPVVGASALKHVGFISKSHKVYDHILCISWRKWM